MGLEDDKFPVFVKWKNRSEIRCKAIPDVLFEAMAHQPVVVGGVLILHEFEHIVVGVRVEVEGLCDLGGIAVDRKMILHVMDDGPCEKHVFDIDLVFPGGTGQDDGQMLVNQVVTDRPKVGERAGNDLTRAAVESHMKKFGAIGGCQDEGLPGNKGAGIFER